jgi:hypothetical protein
MAEREPVLAGVYRDALDIRKLPPVKDGVEFDIKNRVYNTLVSIEYAGCFLSPSMNQSLQTSLQAVLDAPENRENPKILAKTRSLQTALRACPA